MRQAGVTLNRNVVPGESNGLWYTSGLRLGTAAVTTLGMGRDEMSEIAEVIAAVLRATRPGLIASGANTGKASKIEFSVNQGVCCRTGRLIA